MTPTRPLARDLALLLAGALVLAGAIVAALRFTDDEAPVRGAVVTVLVALIAATTAGRRQDRQLAAERERLLEQLGHDRELDYRGNLRELCDEIALALDRCARSTAGLKVAAMEHGTLIGSSDAHGRPAAQALYGSVDELSSLTARLSRQLHVHQAVYGTYFADIAGLMERLTVMRTPALLSVFDDIRQIARESQAPALAARADVMAVLAAVADRALPADDLEPDPGLQAIDDLLEGLPPERCMQVAIETWVGRTDLEDEQSAAIVGELVDELLRVDDAASRTVAQRLLSFVSSCTGPRGIEGNDR